jgi:cytochrome c1
MARQCPRGHDGINPGEVADDMSTHHLTRHAPDLAMEKAKQLEIKIEVTMAEI